MYATNNDVPSKFKMVNSQGLNHIYCYPSTISIKSVGTCQCPAHPFKIPEEENYEITGNRYQYALQTFNATNNFIGLVTAKIQYKFSLAIKPITIDGYEETADFMQRHQKITKTEPFEWIKDLPKHQLLQVASNKVVQGGIWA